MTLLPVTTLLTWVLLLLLSRYMRGASAAEAPRIVFTKQGPVRGMKVDLQSHMFPSLGKVDAFLGIPYTAPPTGQFRFMPPMTPLPWTVVRDCTEFAPVCPQVIPDLADGGDDRRALRYMTVGRLNYLKKLFTYLRNQSEDCLYLNIYSPSRSTYESGTAKHSSILKKAADRTTRT